MPFDPSQPFETVQPATPTGGFDPSKPFEKVDIGPVESAARGAMNNFPLAPQAIAGGESLFGKGDYSSNLADINAKAAAAKAAHPIAYGAGSVAGTAAPLLIPGVGEALEAAPIASGAALGAAGAISNTDILKHPGEAAKEAAIGGAGGAVLGKLGDIFAGAGEPLAEKAAGVRARGIGLSPKLLGNLEPEEVTEYGNFAKMHNLLDQDTEGALGRATAAKEAAGKEIGRIGADALPVPTGPTRQDYIRPLMEKALELDGMAGAEADQRTLLNGIFNIVSKGKNFGELQTLKTFYGHQAFDAAHQVKDPNAAAVYGVIKNMMNDIIDDAPEQYRDAMKTYKMANDAVSGLTRKLGAIRNGEVGQGIGFMGRILGRMPGQSNPAINLPTAAAIGAAGHPMMGLMAATPSINNPAVQASTLDMLAKALPNIPRKSLMAIAQRLMGSTTNEQR